MWELYDGLIEGIPEEITVDSVTVGLAWTVVAAGKYCGAAMTVMEQEFNSKMIETGKGQPLKYLASLAKSWDFIEASIGVAAINAYYNNKETWRKFTRGKNVPWKIIGAENAFDGYAEAVKSKKVAVIGHFKQLEKYLHKAGKISIMERKPSGSDYPDSACEYLLPEQDFVFITGSTMINKTLPRLLQLSGNAEVVLVGPSTPMAPILFEYGVSEMSGFVVSRKKAVIGAVSMGGKDPLFSCGNRMRMIRSTV